MKAEKKEEKIEKRKEGVEVSNQANIGQGSKHLAETWEYQKCSELLIKRWPIARYHFMY